MPSTRTRLRLRLRKRRLPLPSSLTKQGKWPRHCWRWPKPTSRRTITRTPWKPPVKLPTSFRRLVSRPATKLPCRLQRPPSRTWKDQRPQVSPRAMATAVRPWRHVGLATGCEVGTLDRTDVLVLGTLLQQMAHRCNRKSSSHGTRASCRKRLGTHLARTQRLVRGFATCCSLCVQTGRLGISTPCRRSSARSTSPTAPSSSGFCAARVQTV
mmetsp:Transcript_26575/g.62004  ORF Transcript_26575/g.62004 Transcript_26575/m.62004 type:complete len:212 (-) Transcript_26575:340-975(-)